VHYLKLADVCERLSIQPDLLHLLQDESLIEVKTTIDGEAVVSSDDAERLRIICLLMREMEVNLAGVEIILHLREDVISMQHQFDEILRTLVEELKQQMRR
jgi:MerR family transcriptional regulator/heat shock protein HspR